MELQTGFGVKFYVEATEEQLTKKIQAGINIAAVVVESNPE